MALALFLIFILVVGPLALLVGAGADSRIDEREWRRPWQ
jgi:hypothetical protein